MVIHGFLEEFQRYFAITALRHIAFQYFTIAIHRAPKVMRLAVEIHGELDEVPLPI